MSNYKQCPNGHYYNEEYDTCPYCNTSKKEQRFVDWGSSSTPNSKVCPNNHAYVGGVACPYCGEKEVVGSVDMHTGQGYHIIARSAGQIMKVIVDGKEYSHYDMTIGYWVWNWASRIKSNYLIEAGGESLPIYCNTNIQFGNTHLTGREFIKMCDVIIDNQLAIIGM